MLVFSDIHLWASILSVILVNYIFMDGKCDYFQGELGGWALWIKQHVELIATWRRSSHVVAAAVVFWQGRLWLWSTSSFWPCTSSLLHHAHVDVLVRKSRPAVKLHVSLKVRRVLHLPMSQRWNGMGFERQWTFHCLDTVAAIAEVWNTCESDFLTLHFKM